MSEKRKTINEILFDSTYYRNHCTDEYKDSILKDLLLADSGISYKEFIKKNKMIIWNSFVNLLNAAVGRKQDFDELVQSGDISRVMSKMDSHATETEIAMREYDPRLHLINKRADKIILDKNGKFKRKIKRWKLPVGYPKFINEIAVVFIY